MSTIAAAKPKLDHYFKNADELLAENLIAAYIVESGVSFRTVEHPSFKRMIN